MKSLSLQAINESSPYANINIPFRSILWIYEPIRQSNVAK